MKVLIIINLIISITILILLLFINSDIQEIKKLPINIKSVENNILDAINPWPNNAE